MTASYAVRSDRGKRGETEMILLPSAYPTELDAQRALREFRRANPALKAWLVRSPSGEGVSDGRREDLVAGA